jgi:NADPH:quinone reductase-like Zn-dependent oxidoreductase
MRRSYRIDFGAGVDGLTLAEEPVPELEPDQVLVRVHATSLNSRDLMIANGWYPLPVRRQVIPVADGAGEVVAVGEAVSRVAIGDRVIASLFPEWLDGRWSPDVGAQLGGSHDGLLTEFAVIGQQALVLVPEHLSFEEAACLPCAAATAWNSLAGGRMLSADDVVLTLGSGSVSLLSIQLAKAVGARVLATTTTDEKARQLGRLGADVVLKRTDPSWPDQVLEATEGHGADRIVETSGQLEPAIRALAIEGSSHS